jgi:Lrp/AsnC family transcriptional regulator, regulator for asnA, asnC and gidA
LKLDQTDIGILSCLLEDARRPFEDIARELIVSGGTVHVRVNKMREAGIITGSQIKMNYSLLGYDVTAFIGINLRSASDYAKARALLEKLPEVVEIHYTTGQYSIFIKVITQSPRQLHIFLTERLQSSPEIQSTETFISLDTFTRPYIPSAVSSSNSC